MPTRRGFGDGDIYRAFGESVRMSGATSVLFTLANHEQYLEAGDIMPGVFPSGSLGPDCYLDECERMFAAVRSAGADVLVHWADLASYVEWCRSGGRDVDSAESWGAYGGAMIDDIDVFDEGDSLWEMSLRDMAATSEVAAGIDESLIQSAVAGMDDVLDHLEHWMCVGNAGDLRVFATASRRTDSGIGPLWRHFHHMVTGAAPMQYCGDFLSVAGRLAVDAGDPGRLLDDHVEGALECIVALAGYWRGVVGVEHRHGESLSLRAFGVSRGGVVEPVGVEDLGRRLGAPGSPLLAAGWPT